MYISLVDIYMQGCDATAHCRVAASAPHSLSFLKSTDYTQTHYTLKPYRH